MLNLFKKQNLQGFKLGYKNQMFSTYFTNFKSKNDFKQDYRVFLYG